MTSTWPVQDKDGKTVTCTMVMNVSNSGITKVLQFNGKDFESPPEEFLELIRQNEELYIQDLSLHDAVKALLEKNKDAPAVINLQNNEHIVINKDEKMKDLENDTKSNPILSFTSNNVSEVNPQQIATQAIATQTEVNLQHTETQTEVAVQHVETQIGIGSQETETQAEVNLQEAAVQTEVNSQQLDQKLTKAEQEIRKLNEQRNELQYRFDKAEQELEELEKHNSDLQNELGEEKQKNVKLQIGLTQKDEKLENISTELQGKIQELEGAYEEKKDLKKKLEIANVENEKLKGKLNQFEEEREQAEKILSENWKFIADSKSKMRILDDKFNTKSKEVDDLTREYKELKNELEFKNEQIERQREQLRQEIEEEIMDKYHPLLESKFEEHENKIEELMQIVADKVQEIERINKERTELSGKVQYLNNAVELSSPVIDQVFINKKEVFDNNSKMFYQLTEKIDDSEKKPRSLSFDSAFHSDDDDHCNSLLDLISSPSKVCSQSQRGNS
ncbi:hypothetical protein IYZ83_002310 [Wolbachia pipientis]|uniref:hypothetical protein n=1 Tax=Wolbachia pipientis TaxID=955 RepID=UPI001F2C1FB3|nr:hypothetical protein [Wolbachia pipientis]UIP92042.1 hypothetical protein IYZ83_002310 [Wolbachia pipientis]